MSDIHSELQREILLRLPAEPLLRFRAVCKSWRRTIDDPSFARSHFIKNQRSSPNLLIRSKSYTGALYSLSLDSLIHADGEQMIDATRVNYLDRQDVAQPTGFTETTCNGLILIPDRIDIKKIWVIWNPFTGDFHELPQPDNEANSVKGYGIGYDSASEDYKVVLIHKVSCDGESVYRTSVYSLGLSSWKMIMDCPIEPWTSKGEFLNGALYWGSQHTMIVLDLATEKYHQLAAPPEWGFNWNTLTYVLDGCLVVNVINATKRAWVMKDNGVELWVELFSSEQRHLIDGWRSKWDWPIAYSKSQRQLILQHDSELLVWDIEKGSAKMVTIHGLPFPPSSRVCPISIFRFNNSVGGVKRRMDEANTRLKFLVTTSTDIPYDSISDDSPEDEDEED